MVSLVLLTLSVALGFAEVVRLASPAWPRFVIAALHRNASLLAVAFLGVHIATAVADSFAPIRLVDVFVPFVSSYRPLWLGLGTVAFDLMLALVITSLLRERIGYGVWRAVHWASYAAWPVALLHGLGTGSDTRVRWAVIVNVMCLVVVLAAVLSRVGWTRSAAGGRRVLVALGSISVAVGVTTWMVLEPMRPGWARKAGTPTALSRRRPGTRARLPEYRSRSRARPGDRFADELSDNRPHDRDDRRPAHVGAAGTTPCDDRRTALPDGGVSMRDGHVCLGVAGAPDLYHGTVVSLDGSAVRASRADRTALRSRCRCSSRSARPRTTWAELFRPGRARSDR